MAVTTTPVALKPNTPDRLALTNKAKAITPWPTFSWRCAEPDTIEYFSLRILRLGPLDPILVAEYQITDGEVRVYKPFEAIPACLPPASSTPDYLSNYYSWSICAKATDKDESPYSNSQTFYVSDAITLLVSKETLSKTVTRDGETRRLKSKSTVRRPATRSD